MQFSVVILQPFITTLMFKKEAQCLHFFSLGLDFNHESSIPQSTAFLLLCWHDLPRLYVLWMDRSRAIPREGNSNRLEEKQKQWGGWINTSLNVAERGMGKPTEGEISLFCLIMLVHAEQLRLQIFI